MSGLRFGLVVLPQLRYLPQAPASKASRLLQDLQQTLQLQVPDGDSYFFFQSAYFSSSNLRRKNINESRLFDTSMWLLYAIIALV
jgi:hypothetical protein